MTIVIDIDVDWNEEDDTGLPWTLLDRAPFPDRIVPGAYVVAGRGRPLLLRKLSTATTQALCICGPYLAPCHATRICSVIAPADTAVVGPASVTSARGSSPIV